jgi:hypothetical protein
LKFRHQFVAALEDAELLCTIVHIPVRVQLSSLKHRCKYTESFVAALERAELLCTVILGIGWPLNSIGTEFRLNFLLSFFRRNFLLNSAESLGIPK